MRKWTCELLVAIGLLAIPNSAPAQTQADEPAGTEMGHVRSHHLGLRSMITTASDQSPTFRRMVETIDASDGIVYIDPGDMPRHGVRACLVSVSSAGGHRFLFVRVDIGEGGSMRSWHRSVTSCSMRVEMLGKPEVTDPASMYFFYTVQQRPCQRISFLRLRPLRR